MATSSRCEKRVPVVAVAMPSAWRVAKGSAQPAGAVPPCSQPFRLEERTPQKRPGLGSVVDHRRAGEATTGAGAGPQSSGQSEPLSARTSGVHPAGACSGRYEPAAPRSRSVDGLCRSSQPLKVAVVRSRPYPFWPNLRSVARAGITQDGEQRSGTPWWSSALAPGYAAAKAPAGDQAGGRA